MKEPPADSSRSKLARRILVAAAASLVIVLPAAWLTVRGPPAVPKPADSGNARTDPGVARLDPPSAPDADRAGAADAGGGSRGAGGDPGGATSDAEPEPPASIRGVVVTPEGTPIPGARVEAESSPEPRYAAVPEGADDGAETSEPPLARRPVSCLSDARGRFEIAGLPVGPYDLEISARGFGRRSIADANAREEASEDELLRIVLQPELHVRGQVVDRRARAIEGAEVTLTYLAADASGLETGGWRASTRPAPAGPVHRARTDVEGRFDAGGLARGVYRAEASGPGRSPTVAPLVEVHERNDPDESHLLFELDEARVIRGIIRTKRNGKALSGARVRLVAFPAGWAWAAARGVPAVAPRIHSVLTGNDGAFEFEDGPEDARLEVSAGGHRGRTIDIAAGGEPLVVVLEPAAPLEGRVIDRISGDPVPDAQFRLETSALLARADSNGVFSIASLPEGGTTLEVSAEGYDTLELELPDAPPASGWTLGLERSGSVSGRVRAAAKLPVDRLRVSLLREAPPFEAPGSDERSGMTARAQMHLGVSSTDAGGFFRVFVPASGSYRVIVDGDPFATAMSQPVAVPDGQARVDGVDIHLDLAGGAKGFIVAAGGGAVAGARVSVVPELPAAEGSNPSPSMHSAEAALAGTHGARTDATGAFAVGGIGKGLYRLIGGAPGFVTARSEIFQVAPGVVSTIHLELEPEMTISGRVVDATGEPVPLAEIHAYPSGESAAGEWSVERSISSVLGTFRLSRLAARPYDLRFAAHGFGPAAVWNVAAGTDSVEARLEKLVSLAGKVSGAFTGEPVAEFKLRLELEEERRLSPGEKESLHRWREFSDPSGTFRIDDVPPGLYRLSVEARGHLGLEGLELEISATGLVDAEVRLEESGLIAGAVVDANGNAVAGAQVVALERRVDPDRGTVSYRPLRVPALKPERAGTAAKEGGGPPGEGGGGRRGRRREGGDRDEDWVPAAALTKEDGSFHIRGLPDGTFRLSIAHEDYLARELGDLIIEAGVCSNSSLASSILLPFGVVLRGRVRGLAEVQSGSIRISLRPVVEGGDPRAWRLASTKSARVDDSGHFEIRGLATGDYVLGARFRKASDGSPVSIRRDVNIHGAGREQGLLLDLSRR